MADKKRIGIWMDHASAHLMEFTADAGEVTTVESAFTHEAKEETLVKSEGGMQQKEQHLEAEYYRNLGDVIKNFDHVLLFGPTKAKAELANILKADHHFDKIEIEVAQTDKMTEHQQLAFVKTHFSKQ